MLRFTHRLAFIIAPLAVFAAFATGVRPVVAHAFASSSPGINCSAVTISVQPGLNPRPKNARPRVPADMPRGHVTVSLPLYPGATPLKAYVASPFSDYPADSYLQTGSAEYTTLTDSINVEDWYDSAFVGCGWHEDGNWTTNASAFTSGVDFVSNANHDLEVEISFGDGSSGGAYIGYGVVDITYPPRPAASFLRGPFVELRIALAHNTVRNGKDVSYVVHRVVDDESAIGRLVAAVNAIKDYWTVPVLCFGEPWQGPTPAWMSFVRPDGSVVRGYEIGPGRCNGLAVNHVRWLTDDGAVWNLLHRLAKGGR